MPQSLAQVYLHIVYGTKHREPFLTDRAIRQEMHAYLGSIIKAHDSIPVCVGGVAEHVHILCTLPRTVTYAKLVGESKRSSSRWIKTKGRPYANFRWQNGYGAFSVSHSILPKVRNYILRQEEHHQKKTFEKEYLEFLVKHAVQYDERYVWD